MVRDTFCLRFSGITVRFDLPTQITVPQNFRPFLCPDTDTPDDRYTVELLHAPLRPSGPRVLTLDETDIYETDKGWLHIHPVLGDGEGCQVACLFCPDGRHTVYYPASKWAYYSEVWNCSHLIQGEQLLARHDAMLLHSSLVLCQGKTLLFSGPSGAGKSTHAALWEAHTDARVLNGDRTVIQRRSDGTFWGGGSIWSGTSGIFSPEQAPIAAIFLVEKSPENRVERLGASAFPPLYTQTILRSWDSRFMEKILDLFSQLLDQIPVYRLYCRPDREAVELVAKTVFGKEAPL